LPFLFNLSLEVLTVAQLKKRTGNNKIKNFFIKYLTYILFRQLYPFFTNKAKEYFR